MASRRRPSKIEGLAEFDKLLRRLPGKIGKRVLTSAVRKGGNLLKKEAQSRAPRKTGELAGEIRLKADRGSGHSVAFRIGPTGDVFYGMFVEFGTKFMAARPYLRPAFDARKKDAIEAIGIELGKQIHKAAIKLQGPFAKSGLAKRRRRKR